MGVTVNFWAFSKRKNSTKVPTALPSFSYDCQIRTEATLTEPVIELNTGEAKGMTYAQIGDFGRYYFIREWRFERGLWSAYLEVDVLATYKSQIGAQTMYVTRSASSYDGDIKDMTYPTTDAVTNNYKTVRGPVSFASGSIVIGVLGENGANASTIYYQMTPSDFSTMMDYLFISADGVFQGTDIITGIVNAITNPTQYIVSCRWYPFAFPVGSSVTAIHAGLWNSNLDGQHALSNTNKLDGSIQPVFTANIDLPKHPKASVRGSYLNLPPFARYAIQWGASYDLDPTLLAKQTQIYVRLTPDFTNTDALLEVFPGSNGSTNFPLISAYVPCGIDIPLAHDTTSLGSLMQLAGGFAASVMTGDAVSAVAGIASAIAGTADSMLPTVSATRSGGGLVASMNGAYLKAAFYDVVDDDLAEFGRPLMKAKQISTLSGYVRCQNDDVNISCLDPERDRIRSFMTGGFFYE